MVGIPLSILIFPICGFLLFFFNIFSGRKSLVRAFFGLKPTKNQFDFVEICVVFFVASALSVVISYFGM